MRVVARFWNEDGVEMPALIRDPERGLVCPWNFLTLVAPDVVAELERLRGEVRDLEDASIEAGFER